jgi:Ni/Fe-hydrogenase subunit HybB-like protein
MVIVESYLCQRAFNHHLERDLLEPLGRAMVVVLSVYGILRLQDLARRGALAGLRRLDYEGGMFLLEMVLGVLLPIVLLAIPRVRARQPGLVTGAVLAILGFVVNRLNVSVTGMERSAGVSYFPSWMEFAVSLALIAGGFAIFGLAVRCLPIFPEGFHGARTVEAPAWLVAQPAWGFAEGSSVPCTGESTPDAARPWRSLSRMTHREGSTPLQQGPEY